MWTQEDAEGLVGALAALYPHVERLFGHDDYLDVCVTPGKVRCNNAYWESDVRVCFEMELGEDGWTVTHREVGHDAA